MPAPFKELEAGRAGQAANRSNGQNLVPSESNGCELTWGLCSVLPAATSFRRFFLLLLLHRVMYFCFCVLCVCSCVFLCEFASKVTRRLPVVCGDSYEFFDDEVDA